MEIGAVTNSSTEVYGNYAVQGKKAETAVNSTSENAVVYEKGETAKKPTYTVNKMSKEDRDTLIKQLKTDQESRQKSLMDLVHKMMTGQAKTFTLANGAEDEDSVWKFLAGGKYEVDEETKKKAQEDISEDGYWGIKQTSQRLFDFASALAGNDEKTMRKMQDAMMKGFNQATKSWGRELPSISKDTIDAANQLFDDYYKQRAME